LQRQDDSLAFPHFGTQKMRGIRAASPGTGTTGGKGAWPIKY
jgi:hypothetical protein